MLSRWIWTEKLKCTKKLFRLSWFISIWMNVSFAIVLCISWQRDREENSFFTFTLAPNTRKKNLKQRADESKEYHFYYSRTFHRTNSLIALLCTGTCTVCRTWHDLVSMEKFYTNFFFRYPHWIKIFLFWQTKRVEWKSFPLFPFKLLVLLFHLYVIYVSLVFGGLLSIFIFSISCSLPSIQKLQTSFSTCE